jgi:DNA-binding response OmpR family regulator
MYIKNSKNIKVLYVEDDNITRENGVEYLENYFDNIYEARDAFEALDIYSSVLPDIIITDIQMPKLNGLEFIKRVRKIDKNTQVIITTAFSDKEYLLKAIELQLVKYLIKPISESEFDNALKICVDSIHNNSSNIIQISKNSTFDIYNNTLIIDEEIVKLRTKEIKLLTLLLKNKNRYVTYTEIENYIWEDSVMTKDALKTLIKNLKSKLPKDKISNLTGTGYKIEL